MTAVTFDFGQTLAELDSALVARRLAERRVEIDPARVDAECLAAWDVYNEAKRSGAAAAVAWKAFMSSLLSRSGVATARVGELTDWLWEEQPRRNLWRRPVRGMIELARELRGQHVPVGILSNSEGRLAELIGELGWSEVFRVVVDSGKLPFEKPDPRIFTYAADQLDVPVASLVHVGDAWEADVRGALAVGARAVYFSPNRPEMLPARVTWARDADEVREALRGLLPMSVTGIDEA